MIMIRIIRLRLFPYYHCSELSIGLAWLGPPRDILNRPLSTYTHSCSISESITKILSRLKLSDSGCFLNTMPGIKHCLDLSWTPTRCCKPHTYYFCDLWSVSCLFGALILFISISHLLPTSHFRDGTLTSRRNSK
ncbi:hypothetical protein CLIB1423_23S01024 [[Candida] railenensis]|uniref:Uncharacterized protein n=1 Tax=[Candida] railenensis TaxID=45579 RepID=A0A9P0VZP1_9ASCO|nr:hypothetical protein CLIB1423_23S01024 [[Candida] railenensis]